MSKLQGLQGRRGPLPTALAPAEELEQGGADAVAEVFQPDVDDEEVGKWGERERGK